MSKKLFSKVFILLLVVGLLFAAAPTRQALAQTGPTITTVPVAGATVCGTSANTTTTVDIMVAGVSSEIYGYQVELDYDPSQVTIDIEAEPSPIVNGGYLPDGGYSVITNDTTTGLLSIGYSLLRPTEPVTAVSGKLVTITLTHLGNPGTVALDLVSGTTLTDRDGIAVTPASISGATITRESPVVAIGSTEYCDLQEAVTAAVAGNTLTVLRDFDYPAKVDIEKEITFDMATFNVTRTGATSPYDSLFDVKAGGDLTLAGTTGSINGTSTGGVNGTALQVSGGKATLSSGTLKGDYVSVQVIGTTGTAQFDVSGGYITDGIVVKGPQATLNVSGGEITSDYFAPITGNGNAANHGTTINISGGTITFPTDVAIYHPQVGTLNITGGTISGRTGIALKAGTLNISANANIIGTGAYSAPAFGGSGQDANGSAILIYGGTGYTGVIDVNITGGTISSEHGYAVEEFIKSTDTVTRTTIDISGGTLNSGSTGTVKFTDVLVTAAGGVTPNDFMSLTGGWYEIDPAYYVFPSMETYAAEGGFRIRAMYPFAIVRGTETLLFPTLKDAVDGALANETIILRLNHTATCPADPAIVTKTLTIEMNGFDYDWPCAVGYYDAPLVVDGGALTIQDSSVAKTGSIKGWNRTMGYPDGRGAAIKIISGSATLESGTLTAGDTSVRIAGNNDIATWNTPRPAAFTINGGIVADSIYLTGNGAAATINDGLVTTPGPFAAIQGNGNANNGGTQITINGGNVTADGMAIYHPQQGDLNINGGTITAGSPIQMKAGNLTITNGTITANQTTWVEVPALTGSGAEWTGDAIFVFNRNGYGTGQVMNVTISGNPVITSASGYALREYTAPGETSRLGVATISGGTFNGGAPGAVSFTTNFNSNLDLLPGSLYSTNPAAFVYSPYRTYDAGGGLFGIQAIPPVINTRTNTEYFDLQLAVNEAEPSDTLKFQLDYTISTTVTIGKELTLDLNGKTATIPTGGYGLDVTSTAGNLTITDSFAGASGAITGGYNTVWVGGGATFTLDKGSLTGALYGVGVVGTGSTVTVNGGTVTGLYFAIAGNGSAGQGGTTINITGGSLSSQYTAIYHPQAGTLNISGDAAISGHTGIEMRSGTLNISGTPTITTWGGFVANPGKVDGGSVESGDAILVYTHTDYAGEMVINISGGTFTSATGYALREYVADAFAASDVTSLTVTGGKFYGGLDAGEAGAAVTFSDLLVAANTAGTSDLDLQPGGLYNTNPAAFVYVPYGAYLDTTQDPEMYGIRLLPTISGLVTMQGRPTVRDGVPLALNATAYTATSNEMTDINYYFIGVELGPYTFTTSQPRYLNIMANISVNDLANMQLPSLRLLGGDVNQDYKISVADASDVGTAWGSTANPEANINYDGIVNIQDLALVGGNFGLNRESAYPGWNVVPMPVEP